MSKRDPILKQLDWVTALLYLTLVLMGWANIYSAAYNPDFPNIFDMSREYGKQAMWIGVSLVIGIGVMIIRGKFYRDFAYLIYLAFMLLLVAVLLFGKKVNGATSWFGVGSFGIQPSEFAKFSTALALSYYLGGIKQIQMGRDRLRAGAILLIPVGLIAAQPDLGTVLVFAGFVLVLYREGLSGNILLIGLAAAILAVLTLILSEAQVGIPFTDKELGGKWVLMLIILGLSGLAYYAIQNFMVPRIRKTYLMILGLSLIGSIGFIASLDFAFEHALEPHQQSRIKITLGLEEDPQGAGYNVKQSKTAIGSGGFSGKGYLVGTLTKHKYVPMQSTDFIFCTIGEEWGFLGTSVVIIIFALLIIRIILLSDRQRSPFSRVYAYCVAMILFLHLTINVGMTIGLAPVIGIPLPFFSYGGSSLIAFTVMIAILLRLDSERWSQLY